MEALDPFENKQKPNQYDMRIENTLKHVFPTYGVHLEGIKNLALKTESTKFGGD